MPTITMNQLRDKRQKVYDIESESHTDTPRFKAYMLLVFRAIPKDGYATVGSIRRALGENEMPRWTQDAIDGLVGQGSIRASWTVKPTRYERTGR